MPQKQHPRAELEAQHFGRDFNQTIDSVDNPIQIATIADTTTLVSYGFVTATTQKGAIRVFGVPLQTVIPGMRVYVLQMNPGAYIYQSVAPIPFLGHASKALNVYGLYQAQNNIAAYYFIPGVIPHSNATYYPGLTPPGSFPLITLPSGLPAQGWYWSFFVYIESVPNYTVDLLDFPLVSSGSEVGGLLIGLNPNCILTWQWYGSLGNLSSTGLYGASGTRKITLAPHSIWFITFQLGNGIMLNGVPAWTTADGGGFGTEGSTTPTLTAGTYSMYLMDDSQSFANSNSTLKVPPVGTWMAKIQFGCSAVGGQAVWPYPAGFVPTSDSQIANGNAPLGKGLTTYARYLLSEVPYDPVFAANSALAGDPTVRLQAGGDVKAFGPY